VSFSVSYRLCVSHPELYPLRELLLSKIYTRTATVAATIAVIGLGYVGLPLAVAFAEKGFPVTFVATQCRPFDCAQDRLWH
jgi:pyruvate/2-oxoglutarate dehydrogenase complex dihydrolipoamide dehydrogenase (E3) component